MSNELVRVRLFGDLAEKIGRSEWGLAVQSPTEALQAIEANTGKMIVALLEDYAAEYFVVINGKPVQNIEEMSIMRRKDLQTIDFLPVFRGAGNNSNSIWMIVVGVLLVALVVVASYGAGTALIPALATGAGSSGVLGTIVLGMGLSLVFAGIAGLLAPTSHSDTVERPENTPSYIFNGTINTYRQGNPIPVGFGRMIVGSQIVSVGVRAINIDVTNPVIAA